MNKVKVKSPAKINLSLKIGNVLKNGLHKIDSIFHKINLCDDITIEKINTKGRQKIQIKIIGEYAKGVPSNLENTAYKSAKAFFKQTHIKDSIKIVINKNIPSKSGLGGASSNASSVLNGLEQLFCTKLENKLNIASDIGSDVPFFTSNFSSARVFGTGEKIEETPSQNFYCIICMLPYINICTTWAYQKLDEMNANNFRDVIYRYFPDLSKLEQKMIKLGADKSSLSGSGSAIFGIFEDRKKLDYAYEKLKDECIFIGKYKSL